MDSTLKKIISSKPRFLTGNQLKIIALISMTVDHIGLYFFPHYMIFRYIGRIAFPVFAYMIAEGCKYTKNRKKYLITVAIVGFICQVVYSIATRSLYQNIFITFLLSISLIYIFDNAKKKRSKASYFYAFLSMGAVFFICEILPGLIPETGFQIDYGFIGVLLPVLVYNMKTKTQKLLITAGMLFVLTITLGKWQLFNLLSLPLLYFYNGKRGKRNLKYLFYIYYPVHLAVIFVVNIIIS